jgi:hypothetical protein
METEVEKSLRDELVLSLAKLNKLTEEFDGLRQCAQITFLIFNDIGSME